jgi:hypothetical protein
VRRVSKKLAASSAVVTSPELPGDFDDLVVHDDVC